MAYIELATFDRYAADAVSAPDLATRQSMSRLAGLTIAHQQRLLDRIADLGGDPVAELSRYVDTLNDFDARTTPSTWWEGVLKGHVGYAILDDFCRLVATGLPSIDAGVVEEITGRGTEGDEVRERIAEAAGGDPVLASRLALWGRRLVGEALGVVQVLMASELPAPRSTQPEKTGAVLSQQEVFSLLTADHTRRMGRLGLAA